MPPTEAEASLAEAPTEALNVRFAEQAGRLARGLPADEVRSLAPFWFAPVLPQVFLCGRDGDSFRLRVAGSGFASLFGREVNDLTFEEAFSHWPHLLMVERARANAVFSERRVGVVRGVLTYPEGRRLAFETVLVPVPEGDDVSFGLGHLEANRI